MPYSRPQKIPNLRQKTPEITTNQLGKATLWRFAYLLSLRIGLFRGTRINVLVPERSGAVVAGSPRARNVGVGRLVRLGALANAGLLLLGACNTTYLEQARDEPQNAADIMRAADLRPRSPQPTGGGETGGASPPKAFSFFGWSAPPAAPQTSGSRDVEALAPAEPNQPSGSRDAAGGAGATH
jgi:hypothetical protein